MYQFFSFTYGSIFYSPFFRIFFGFICKYIIYLIFFFMMWGKSWDLFSIILLIKYSIVLVSSVEKTRVSLSCLILILLFKIKSTGFIYLRVFLNYLLCFILFMSTFMLMLNCRGHCLTLYTVNHNIKLSIFDFLFSKLLANLVLWLLRTNFRIYLPTLVKKKIEFWLGWHWNYKSICKKLTFWKYWVKITVFCFETTYLFLYLFYVISLINVL